MYTLTVWLALFDDTCSDLNTCDTCFCLFFVCFQFLEHLVRNMNTGNIIVHEFSHSGGLRNNDTNLYRFSELFCFFHEFDEFLRLKYCLCLEVFCTCSYFSFHFCKLCVNGIAARRYNSTLGEFRRLANQFVSTKIHTGFQKLHCVKKGYGVKVEYRFCLWVVTHLCMVTCEAEDVVNAQHCSAEKIRLQSDTVSVTACKLEDRIHACILENLTHCKRSKTHNRRLVISYVNCMNILKVCFCFFYQLIYVDSFWRSYFCRNYKFTTVE